MDWYRQKSWSKDIEDFFFQKLNRARKDGRAQYLKIQAIELVDTGNLNLFDVAETLLNKLFIDYPDDKFNRASALKTFGDIYRLRKEYNKAIDFYKQAVDFEATYPQVQTQAYLYFAELVVKIQKIDLYDAAEQLIEKRIDLTFFPVEKYKGYSILSIIASHKNNDAQASHFAKLAEQNANETTSGLRYHKYLGVVRARDSWLDRLIKNDN
ncbi:hypothetical protein EOD41_09820 [Mucilaginibacter limnophilus]|uniref:Uncharacterized protein n=1 Tax=Mucilaginibacter limnophilus TaxID=1932778 RepID=A0A3S2UL69_9SPHI|nr:hypothetical protein [Mucilaginibacter limnophilus]RVU00922.1 hypothetical protein EOD41_09820 [Mucilaginibacter limnophilus]